ncbi:MAG: vWA domain-containing protein [Gammaproteobacteria bacterium]|nr:vWA domain-containing protein [Gammaproteobacteria bacterium]
MGGEHVLILMDASASMLHRTIVNAIRFSNMDKASKLQSEKWQRAIRTVEWIMANLPPESQFQLMTFNTDVTTVLTPESGDWLASIEREQSDEVLARLKDVEPGGGTSLHFPFAAISRMDPMPDNIFLIVDSLPTIGDEPPKRSAIPSRQRVDLFLSALEELPQSIPVNVILFLMEGDRMATPHFWILAQMTGGSFLTPSEDWP